MTNLEYIQAQLSRFGLEEPDLLAVLASNEIDPSEDVNIESVRLAIYNELPLLIAGLSEVAEGGYRVKWNIEGIKAWYSWLAAKLGLKDELSANPTLTYIGNRW